MADIATAYVQIVPSARGMQSKLSEIFGKEMPGAGKSAGNILGSNLAGTLKKVLASAAIVEALKKTLTEGAALQQTLGGVETLFKDSAAVVIANAEQAYRTAGLSANAYMEQVTSFSASLLQSLGGDTVAAANVADMALRDISDNANKFGTDMERLTDAYQGFAKGQYQLLDNLKLGYGGTKTEMQRLLADAQKLTGVKYDINNLADVYSAIHAIQEELGVTGTTAEEASKTLTGSFNAMKGAFTNVLGKLALGQAIGPSLNALAQTVSTFLVGNLIPMVWNIITALPGALMTFLKALIPGDIGALISNLVSNLTAFMSQSYPLLLQQGVSMISNLVSNLTAFISQSYPLLLQQGVSMISNLAAGFLQGIPDLLIGAGELVNQLLTAFISALPSLLESGAQLILNLASGLISSAPDVVSSAVSIIGELISTIASHLPDLLAQGISLIAQLIAGLISMIPDVITGAGDIIKNICDTFAETDWLSVGTDIIRGIGQGIRNGASIIIEAAKEAAQKAFNAAKEFLGIASPSRLFRAEVGYQISAGAALGITDGIPMMTSAMNDLTRATNTAFTSRLRMNAGDAGAQSGFGRQVIVNQYIYSQAHTAADLMREARYEAEKAVLLGV